MKTFIILVLLLALVVAAFLTRPARDDFTTYLLQASTQGDNNFIKKGLDELRARAFLNGCQFKDRLLWVDVEKDGKTVYTVRLWPLVSTWIRAVGQSLGSSSAGVRAVSSK